MSYYLRHIAAASAILAWGTCAAAQSFEAVGTRAAGMGGAFVAVADDASAAYWNPAGFASGDFFSIVFDRGISKSDPDAPDGARKGAGLLFAMGMPALGLSYYPVRSTVLSSTAAPRLRATAPRGPTDGLPASRKAVGAGQLRLDTLVTHHTGATLLQSIGTSLAVGGTLKVVRGIASSNVVPDGPRETLLDGASELGGKGTTRLDADVGVMLSGPLLKAGLTVRNLTSPEFATPDGSALRLPRQARGGIAVAVIEGWIVDADLDLTRIQGPLGAVREFAAGTEGRVNRKTFVRGGLRLNTAGDSAPAVAGGASYMIVRSLLLDAQITGGVSRANRGWGISARLVY
jgi:hypothetical protein